MKKQPSELMREAREALSGKWGLAIGTFFIAMLITGVCQGIPYLGPIAGLIITGPITLGGSIFALAISRNRPAEFNLIFSGFNNFVNALVTHLLMFVFIILWALLLVIPGIIAAISYSQAFYLLADNPSLNPMEAIDKSKALMDGHKTRYFMMLLNFFGLALLCILTLGIGFFWLIPFVHVTSAKFYDDLVGAPAEMPLEDHLIVSQ